jgi:hypothetical protein
MFAADPLGISLYSSNNFTPQTTVGLTQEVAYKNKNHSAGLMLLLMRDKHGLLNIDPSIQTKYFYTVFNYDYRLDESNKLNLQLYYARYEDIFNIDKLEDWSGYASWSSSYRNLDFFNSLIWHKNSLNHVNYFDLTSSITWNASENLSFTLKGENLLDKAKETGLLRIDPVTMSPMAPLEISPVDKRITLEMEYTF